MIDFSILICVYNPDNRLLSRCIGAVQALDTSDITCEVILVDNNSSPGLLTYPVVQEAQRTMSNFVLLTEQKQGISYARIAGTRAAKGKYIVIFDGDNDPYPDYLQRLSLLIKKYPSVGAWGPGNVWVDFIDGVDEKLRTKAMVLFQERHDMFAEYACLRSWEDCYPYGTGLCIKREHVLLYIKLFDNGTFTLKGREGNRLSSGEDTQMVLCCIVNGEAAGRSPDLKLKHVIPANRANIGYMKRLAYGGHIDYDLIMKQVMPEYRANFGNPLKKGLWHTVRLYKKMIKAMVSGNVEKTVNLIEYCSLRAGAYQVLGKPIPATLSRILKMIKASY